MMTMTMIIKIKNITKTMEMIMIRMTINMIKMRIMKITTTMSSFKISTLKMMNIIEVPLRWEEVEKNSKCLN